MLMKLWISFLETSLLLTASKVHHGTPILLSHCFFCVIAWGLVDISSVEIRTQVRDFVSANCGKRKVAIVTSGGTLVPLERNTGRATC